MFFSTAVPPRNFVVTSLLLTRSHVRPCLLWAAASHQKAYSLIFSQYFNTSVRLLTWVADSYILTMEAASYSEILVIFYTASHPRKSSKMR